MMNTDYNLKAISDRFSHTHSVYHAHGVCAHQQYTTRLLLTSASLIYTSLKIQLQTF